LSSKFIGYMKRFLFFSCSMDGKNQKCERWKWSFGYTFKKKDKQI